ncbi:MAG: leucine-rich repeat domain-containing protein [Roseibacillus sp.]
MTTLLLFGALEAADISNLTWRLQGSEIEITDCDPDAIGDLVIPPTINNFPVTEIGYGAFRSCDSLTSITLPSGIEDIGSTAFVDCLNLTDIHIESGSQSYTSIDGVVFNSVQTRLVAFPSGKTALNYLIPQGVTTIGDYSFSYSNSLAAVTLPDTVTVIEPDAFGNSALLTANLSPNLNLIGYRAFANCLNLENLSLPDSLSSLEYQAFSGCDQLINVTIPANTTSISYGVFRTCNRLKSIQVAAANTNYSSIDGVLFNQSLNTLVQFPAGKLASYYQIPNGTQSIARQAFQNSDLLEAIELPDSLIEIERDAFAHCSGLYEVIFPKSLTSIGSLSFERCENLFRVVISASVEEIEFGTFRSCENLAQVVFEGDPPENIGTFRAIFPFGDTAPNARALVLPEFINSFGGIGSDWFELTVSARQAPSAEIEITRSGFVSAGVFFIEFSPGGMDFKIMQDENLAFENATEVPPLKEPSSSTGNRFEFEACETRGFFQVVKIPDS